MENEGPEIHPEYTDCIQVFEDSLSNDDLANREELFADLEDLGVHPIIANMLRRLSISEMSESYVSKVALVLREKWKYQWQKDFPGLAAINKRFNSLWEDRVLHDPEFEKQLKEETDDMNFNFDELEENEDPGGVSSRARDWIESEEGLTGEDVREKNSLKEYYIVSKMAGFLREVGKEVPAEILEYLDYNSPNTDSSFPLN